MISASAIQQLITQLDRIFATQLNRVLHHPLLQRLEASWRGLYYLANEMPTNNPSRIKLKLLSISWQELQRDMTRATEFDQTELFLKVYHDEFGQPGGEPFGLLIGDYYVCQQQQTLLADIAILRTLAKISAIAFAPFVTAIAPGLLGMEDFSRLARALTFEHSLTPTAYRQWQSLRQDDDARFLGLLLPQVLSRLPYQGNKSLRYPFIFHEDVQNEKDQLWGNAVYCFAAVTLYAFDQTGWFGTLCGARATAHGGRVQNIPTPLFNVDRSILAKKPPLAVYITDQQEKILRDQGFIPLCPTKIGGNAIFYSCQSVKKIKMHQQKLSSRLDCILCISRFAHYLKSIARDKIGSFTSAQACEKTLQEWLHQYIAASNDLSEMLQIKYPLRAAKVTVYERPTQINRYLCTIEISPHYQFDQLQTMLQFTTELTRIY